MSRVEAYTGDLVLRDAYMMAGGRRPAIRQVLQALNSRAQQAAERVASSQAIAALTGAVGQLTAQAMQMRQLKHAMQLAEENAAFQRERVQKLDEMERKKMEAIIEHNKRMDEFAIKNASTQLGLAAYNMLARQKMLSYDMAVRWGIYRGMTKLQAEKMAAMEVRRRAAMEAQRVMAELKERIRGALSRIQYSINVIEKGPIAPEEADAAKAEMRSGLEEIKRAYRDAVAAVQDPEAKYLILPQLKTHFTATMSDVFTTISEAMRSANLKGWAEATSLGQRMLPDFVRDIVEYFSPGYTYVTGKAALSQWFERGLVPPTTDYSNMFHSVTGVRPIDVQIGISKSVLLDRKLMQRVPYEYQGMPGKPEITPAPGEVQQLLQQVAGIGQIMAGGGE